MINRKVAYKETAQALTLAQIIQPVLFLALSLIARLIEEVTTQPTQIKNCPHLTKCTTYATNL